MIDIREVTEAQTKSTICNDILRALPNWFGNEEAIVDYADKVKTMPFCAVLVDDAPVGFLAIKAHNEHTAEVCVMGILTSHHRQGIGRAMIGWCEDRCKAEGKSFLTVKTLDGSHPSKSYARTRLFYEGMGFVPLEVFPLHWGADDPCLMMIKYLGR